MSYIMRAVREHLVSHITSQLPAGIRELFEVTVQTDAYLLRPKATFVDPRGNEWNTYLEPTDIEGVPLRCRVPETFIAQLCTVV